MRKFLTKDKLIVGAALASAGACAYAGSSDTTEAFDDVYDMLVGWTNGPLGKIIALGALCTGLGIGLARQSVMAAVIGIAMSCAFANADSVIDKIVTATASADAPIVQMLDNGMAH